VHQLKEYREHDRWKYERISCVQILILLRRVDTDQFTDGYLLTFKYPPVFAPVM